MEQKFKVGIYARVSTKDQEPLNQLLELRRYTEARGWTIIEEFVDHGVSGAKDSRPAFNRLMDAARKRKIDLVLVSRLDRLGRSVKHLLATLEEFRSLGVSFCSLAENVATDTSMGRLVLTFIGAIAEFEREIIRERIFSGLARARAQGKKLGRPRVTIDTSRVQNLRGQGLSYREIAREMAISKEAARRVIVVPQNPL